ncbi:MAG TPA: hypothetical protein VHX38_02180 [Pseudonocardiaceae bacterium]|jgi:hypothetical protein|nr:hypothetical protein [Pseudonocardiaceae bacterium]
MSISVRAKPSPYEVMIMTAAVIGGAALLLLRQRLGTTLSTSLPAAITVILGTGLLIGGVLTLVGLALRTITGPLLERAGLTGLSILLVVYSGFTLDFVGLRGLITAVFFLALAGAGLWRVIQIRSDLREVERELRDHSAHDRED